MRDERLMDLTLVAHLPTPPAGWHDVSYSLTSSGKLAIRRCTQDLHAHRIKRLSDVSLPPLDAEGARHRCSLFDGRAESDDFELPVNTPEGICDVFPDGNWLIAGGGRPSEANVLVLSPKGELIRRFGIGTGFGSVQCDSAGAFWVGYWDIASGDEFNGLMKFDANGTVLWPPNIDKPPLHVFDCWTLNVIGNKVWAYYELDYPITSIDADAEIDVRRCGVEGASGLAIDGDMAILVGGYEEDKNRLTLLRLHDDYTDVVATFRIQPGWRFDPDRPSLLEGRGDSFHMVHKGSWWRLSVADVLRIRDAS
jgi:hypothetical protein